MLTRGAVLREVPGTFEVVELEVDDPRPGEIRVRMAATGLCHSDDHHAKGDIKPGRLPFAGGHEGAGVVEAVGPGVTEFAEGDHVVFSFLPACGRCRWCARGMQNLCDLGASIATGARWDDPTSYRLSLDGQPVAQMCGLSTFCEVTTVSTASAVKIDPSIPLDVAALTGCGVGTGWGAAVNSAQVRPGDVVIVLGIGGIGINAVQGAAHAGAAAVIAVDPVPFKREVAPNFGATHAVAELAEAAELAREMTNGQGADSAIVAIGVTRGKHVGDALRAVRKGGTCVVVGLGDVRSHEGDIPLMELVLFQKRLQGTLFGASAPTADIPAQLRLWQQGQLKLEELITTRYRLDEVAKGFEDMHAGRNLRGVIVYD
ncbi:S-(hydroxymethyl)glutathione dehydrogenase / alcohol dehydrogenase [Pseudonocardia thermophila]|jgi:oxidoreductase, Rxyl_3153 family|uniref:S-(Hydroxymethyl)glutathione dehydrogenase / alcohol dehydrogenase n=1 Tax=Pseudonocardia thermophila TaxID=1848 RepID=A0A1M6V4G8_PSETH|nr:NDMA-dependent alcohol dehydrogenase [Pseudonocardia thermophila]SHK76340.1 S-(hydroxymethyl)glutathione dehydrogenase / alcohol dehydrogenase [Pseudonocardia thermophila]